MAVYERFGRMDGLDDRFLVGLRNPINKRDNNNNEFVLNLQVRHRSDYSH